MKWIVALLALVAAPAWAGDWPNALTTTSETRLGAHAELTRIVLDVTQITEFRTLVTEQGRRILVGIPSVDWETNRHRLKAFGLIARFDFMRRGLKRGLLVIHTTEPVRVEHQFTLPPNAAHNKGNRLVLDLVKAGAGKVAMPKSRTGRHP
ncbi:MAG: hypothetical protein H7Y60_14970 [Rhodospirillaceae bacterium]|nr:hypothetical protein [Rhodospirillales bacterium]